MSFPYILTYFLGGGPPAATGVATAIGTPAATSEAFTFAAAFRRATSMYQLSGSVPLRVSVKSRSRLDVLAQALDILELTLLLIQDSMLQVRMTKMIITGTIKP